MRPTSFDRSYQQHLRVWRSPADARQSNTGERSNDVDIGQLIALWPEECQDRSRAGCERVLMLLRQALRAERRRGRAGHWTYNLTRHARLHALYRQELARFAETFGALPSGHGDDAPR